MAFGPNKEFGCKVCNVPVKNCHGKEGCIALKDTMMQSTIMGYRERVKQDDPAAVFPRPLYVDKGKAYNLEDVEAYLFMMKLMRAYLGEKVPYPSVQGAIDLLIHDGYREPEEPILF